LQQKRVSVQEFRGISISLDNVLAPDSDRFVDPAAYLYQLGYLSLRPGPSEEEFTLDYPNTEVLLSMAQRVLTNIFKSSESAKGTIKRLKDALSQRDPVGLVREINFLLSSLPYDDYNTGELKEGHYRRDIFTLFYGAELDTRAEIHVNKGRFDVLVNHDGQAWVIELKVSEEGDNDVDLAHEAMKQIMKKNYGGLYMNPIRLGLVINGEARIIKAWECKGGLASKPKPEAKAKKIAKKKTQEKAEKKTQEKAEKKTQGKMEKKTQGKMEADEDEGWKPRF
jgi:hypothetical protein